MLKDKENRVLTDQLLDEFQDEEAQKIETAIWDLGRKSLEGERKRKRGYNIENWRVNKSTSRNNSKSRSPKSKSKKKDRFKIKNINTARCRYDNVFPYYNPYATGQYSVKKSRSLNKISCDRGLLKDPTSIVFDADILEGKNYQNSFRTKPLNKLTIRLDSKAAAVGSKHGSLSNRLKKITNFSKDLDLKFGKLHKMKFEPRYKRKNFYGVQRKESATFSGLKKQLMDTLRGKSSHRKRPASRTTGKHSKRRQSNTRVKTVVMESPRESKRKYESIYSKNTKEKYTFQTLDKSVKMLIKDPDGGDRGAVHDEYKRSVFKKTIKKFIEKNDMRIQFNITKIRDKIVSDTRKKNWDKKVENFIVKGNYSNAFFKKKKSRVMPNTASITTLL